MLFFSKSSALLSNPKIYAAVIFFIFNLLLYLKLYSRIAIHRLWIFIFLIPLLPLTIAIRQNARLLFLSHRLSDLCPAMGFRIFIFLKICRLISLTISGAYPVL